MSTRLIIIGHNQLPQQLLSIAHSIIGSTSHNVESISIPTTITAEQLGHYADQVSDAIYTNQNNEILILCDLYGATPYNLAKSLARKQHIKLITGLNLSMLITAIQNLNEPVQQLSEKVFNNGTQTIILE